MAERAQAVCLYQASGGIEFIRVRSAAKGFSKRVLDLRFSQLVAAESFAMGYLFYALGEESGHVEREAMV